MECLATNGRSVLHPSSQGSGIKRGMERLEEPGAEDDYKDRVFCTQQVSYTDESTVDTRHVQDPSSKPDKTPAWSREVGTVAKEILGN